MQIFDSIIQRIRVSIPIQIQKSHVELYEEFREFLRIIPKLYEYISLARITSE